MTLSKEQQIEQALRYVLFRQKEVLALFREILETTPPEGKTHFDLLCERLDKVQQNAENPEE